MNITALGAKGSQGIWMKNLFLLGLDKKAAGQR
jgi:hypothetical protein